MCPAIPLMRSNVGKLILKSSKAKLKKILEVFVNSTSLRPTYSWCFKMIPHKFFRSAPAKILKHIKAKKRKTLKILSTQELCFCTTISLGSYEVSRWYLYSFLDIPRTNIERQTTGRACGKPDSSLPPPPFTTSFGEGIKELCCWFLFNLVYRLTLQRN